jgi:putative acetyltransferase
MGGEDKMKIEIIEAYDRLEDIRELFAEYAAWLGLPLDFQNFEEEMVSLPGKYTKPDGRLYLMLADGQAAGCIALRYLDTDNNGNRRGEMKRLFVRAPFRGCGLGVRLAERVIAEARQIGYTEILLDSFTFMEKAIAIYKKLGFEEIKSYRYNLYANAVYLKLNLQ